MKKLFIAAVLPLAAMAGANQKTQPSKWKFSLGAQTGVESFHMHFMKERGLADFARNIYGSAASMSLNQSVGYSTWIYLEAQESSSFSIKSIVPRDLDDNDDARSRGVRFFDADIRAYFPIYLPTTAKVNLQPIIGFAVRTSSCKEQEEPRDRIVKMYRSRALSPVAGLALGLEPTEYCKLRAAIALEFPSFKYRTATQSEISPWQYLYMQRIGVNASFDMAYKISDSFDLEGSFSYLNYGATDVPGSRPSDEYDTAYFNRFGAKIGTRWNF